MTVNVQILQKWTSKRLVMANFIKFLYRLVMLYMYYVLGACMLSWVPNINPDYPLFSFIFKSAGFYLIPPILGLSISPAIVMLVCGFVLLGLDKIYAKYFAPKEPKIVVMSPEEFFEKMKEQQNKEEDKKDGD